jgi:hypothetical protein
VFTNEAAKNEQFWWLHRHLVKPHHGNQQVRWYADQTRYSGPRRARNVLALYRDKHCKVTGEVYCVHLDWRIRGVEALRRAGIGSVRDLLQFDQRQFWQQRLRLFDIDASGLGRRHQNCSDGTNRRKPYFLLPGWNFDAYVGRVLLRHYGSVQEIIDQHRHDFDVRRSLLPIATDQFLPKSHYYDYEPNLTIDCPPIFKPSFPPVSYQQYEVRP